jgi:hypothetical protein
VGEGSRADRLAATQHIVVLLRLVADAGGNVLYGEVMNPAGDSGCRFVGYAGIGEAVRACLSSWVGGARIQARGSGVPFEPNGTEHGPVE